MNPLAAVAGLLLVAANPSFAAKPAVGASAHPAVGASAHPAVGASAHSVVSYLLSAGPESTAWTPMEGVATPLPIAHSWEWRVFDPTDGGDRLFLTLPSFPLGIRWDSAFTEVHFVTGGKIARARWAFGEKPRFVTSLPIDSDYCDFWLDRAGVWHVYGQMERMSEVDGVMTSKEIGTRWDLAATGSWTAAVVDSEAGGHYGECAMTPRLEPAAPHVTAIEAATLLADMRLNPDRAVPATRREPDAPREAEDWVWLRSAMDPLLGLEMGGGFGDSYHAFAPVVWVDRARRVRKRVRAPGDLLGVDGAQIAFGERDGRVLIVSEFEGGFPTVVDLKTGNVLVQITRPSARAVWVPAPR